MSLFRATRVVALLATALTTSLSAHAETIYGLTIGSNPTLVKFDSANPSFLNVVGQVSGIFEDFKLHSIDFRPADGLLYGLATQGKVGLLYTIDTRTAVASTVGRAVLFTLPEPELGEISIDFNPVVDRLRVVSDKGLNYRMNPNTGALTQEDLNLAASGIGGIAYANNQAGAASTTLYGYNAQNDTLVTIGGLNGSPSPNGGTVNAIGSSGVVAWDIVPVGFDISGSGAAYLALDNHTGSPSFDSELYTVNLATGATQLLGEVPVTLRDIAVSPVPEPGAMALWLAGIAGMGTVVRRRGLTTR